MDINKLIESLSLNEIKILPHLKKKKIDEISEETDLEKVSVLRALEYLEKKGVVDISQKKNKIIELGVNGALYRNKGLPERKLLNVLRERRILSLQEAQKQSSLSDEEFRVSIGILKRKGMIGLEKEKIVLKVSNEEISKKIPEESFLESLPLSYSSLSEGEINVLKLLENRKDIVRAKEEKEISVKVTELGEKIISSKIRNNLIEQITPKILKKESLWKGKKFRRYDVTSYIPKIHGGKRHFVLQAEDYARRIWMDLGFREMTGDLIQSSFWVFDSLFTPQDHPARELQDTFFLNKKSLGIDADKKIVSDVKKSHEGNLKGLKSRGWGYSWDEEEAKKLVLRTHTTCLSAYTLAKLRGMKNKQGKFFAIGKTFRNETIDAEHLFEFNQTEGIVVDKDANFKHLLGYLEAFLKKMGFEKIRFRPHFFPYTEPSVEADVYDEKTKEWVEILGAGIFRPEVVVPLLGEYVPVLAWGMGFDRLVISNYNIKDIRELYKNDISQLRKMKFWMK